MPVEYANKDPCYEAKSRSEAIIFYDFQKFPGGLGLFLLFNC